VPNQVSNIDPEWSSFNFPQVNVERPRGRAMRQPPSVRVADNERDALPNIVLSCGKLQQSLDMHMQVNEPRCNDLPVSFDDLNRSGSGKSFA
jgi:hypothetical protein